MSLIYPFTLHQDEFIQNKIPSLPLGNTLILAGTGMGKTTYTMEVLSQQHRCAIFVPTVAKVQELQVQYNHLDRFLFCYADQGLDKAEINKSHSIVGTYDKFSQLITSGKSSCLQDMILIVDECHKLYSAGSFRDGALNPLINTVIKRVFKKVVFLTASFTPFLNEQLHICFDQQYHFSKLTSVNRQLTIRHYTQADKYTAIEFIKHRYLQLRQTHTGGPSKKIIIRTDSKNYCEELAIYFEQKFGAKSLIVHSDKKSHNTVQEFLKQQAIPLHYDFLITTSMLDEAININNTANEIDSMHIIGKRIHVEELIQFMGRLRLASVPCFQHIYTEFSVQSVNDIANYHMQHLKRMQQRADKVQAAAEALKYLVDDYALEAETDSDKKLSCSERIRKVNQTFTDSFGCDLLWLNRGQVEVNQASLVSMLYQFDTSYLYSSFDYFKYRFLEIDSNFQVIYDQDDQTYSTKELIAFFRYQGEEKKEDYQACIEPALRYYVTYFDNKAFTSLKEISQRFLESMNDNDQIYKFYNPNYLKSQNSLLCLKVLEDIIYLGLYVDNLQDIERILKEGLKNNIREMAQAYNDNLIVQHIIKDLEQLLHKSNLAVCRISQVDSVKIVLRAVNKLQSKNRLPIQKMVKDRLIKGLKIENGSISIEPSKAMNFLVKYFDVKDVNRNKPTSRYLELQGISYKKLHFYTLNPSNSALAHKIILCGYAHHALTGAELEENSIMQEVA